MLNSIKNSSMVKKKLWQKQFLSGMVEQKSDQSGLKTKGGRGSRDNYFH